MTQINISIGILSVVLHGVNGVDSGDSVLLSISSDAVRNDPVHVVCCCGVLHRHMTVDISVRKSDCANRHDSIGGVCGVHD